MSDWRDGEAREGSPRKIAEDYQLAVLAYNQVVERRGNSQNREARAWAERMRALADEMAAKILGIRAAGALADGIDRRGAPQATRPKNSTIRTGWVKPITVNSDELWHGDHTVMWDWAQMIFNARMDLLKAAVADGSAIVSDPITSVRLRVTARTVPNSMYAERAPEGYGSYLPENMNEIHWYDEQGSLEHPRHMQATTAELRARLGPET